MYIEDKGIDKIRNHAYDFVTKRLADTSNVTDGKQTPMKGHPVFIAQHATGTCCRGCLGKWHHIGRNRIMSDTDVKYVVDVIMTWIDKEYSNYKKITYRDFLLCSYTSSILLYVSSMLVALFSSD